MKKFFKFIAFICIITVTQNSFAQNEVTHICPNGDTLCFIFDVVCNNCIIDGNVYLVRCGMRDTLEKGSYHVEYVNDHWQWGNGDGCPCYHNGAENIVNTTCITRQELIELVKDIKFPLDCCGNGGGDSLNCNPPLFMQIDGIYQMCTRYDIECCNNEILVNYQVFDCNSYKIFINKIFSATCINPNEPQQNGYWIVDNDFTELLNQILQEIDLNPCIVSTNY